MSNDTLQRLYQLPIHAGFFCVVDTETTGLKEEDDLVEMAGAYVDNGFIFDEWHRYCYPSAPIQAEAAAVHGITLEKVKGAPNSKACVRELVRYLDEMELDDERLRPIALVAHNAKFDRYYMEKADHWLRGTVWLCTYRLARHLHPDLEHYSNEALAEHYGHRGDEDLHRADADVALTARNLLSLLEVAKEQGYTTIGELVELCDTPVQLKKMPFGKHKGTPFTEIRSGYLSWLVSQPTMDVDVVTTARGELESRAAKWGKA